jgi:hypothetical protein
MGADADAQDCLIRQMQESALPIHPLLPPLIDVFAGVPLKVPLPVFKFIK